MSSILSLNAPPLVPAGGLASSPAGGAGPPVTMRPFNDPASVRRAIYDSVLAEVAALPAAANSRYRLELGDLTYVDPENVSTKEHKRALLEQRTLARRLRGTWRLRDANGNILQEKTQILAHVPVLTDRGTFVLAGTEYGLANQMRVRPGIFHRRKSNDELEAHVNVAPGRGRSHRLLLEPASGVFRMVMDQSHLPLISVLRAMGASDKELRDAWGDAIFAANARRDSERALQTLYEKLRPPGASAQPDDRKRFIAEAMHSMQLDPEVTRRTLQHPHERISKDVLLASTRKLLALARGQGEVDDRDHLAFQQFMGPEDLLAERIRKGRSLLQQLLWKVTTRGNLDRTPSGLFTPLLRAVLLDSGLGSPLEETNAMDMADQGLRVTRLGYGGISSLEAVPRSARSVHPSHVNFLDLVVTPESLSIGVDGRIVQGARKGSDGRIYNRFIDVRTGQEVWKSPQEVDDLVVAFAGEMQRGTSHVYAMQRGNVRRVPISEVQLAMPGFDHSFGVITNLVPLKSASVPQRISMGSRYILQALPLQNAEVPLVQNQRSDAEESYEESHAERLGAVRALRQPGRVMKVGPEEIVVRYDDGVTHTHELFHNFPNNRLTFVHSVPLVQTGDRVEPGQLLARSNMTDERGTLALGLNLRTAYMVWGGKNYEDAWVISESAAKKLSSEHMYQHVHEHDPRVKPGKASYVSIFPSAHPRAVLERMDDDGVIRPGEVVQPGQPLILLARAREQTRKSLHRSSRALFDDASVLWDKHVSGIVTDVTKTPEAISVVVKAVMPAQVGDKLAGLYGDKGVIADIVPDDQMPRDRQGRPMELLANPLGLPSRTNASQILAGLLGRAAAAAGKPYKIRDFADIEDLTEFVETELKKHGLSPTEELFDPVTGRKLPSVLTGLRYMLKLHHTSASKGQGRGLGGYTSEDAPARGSMEGGRSKMFSLMETHAALSHGATEVLRDARLLRGQRNPEYFAVLMSGGWPSDPAPPTVYAKFLEQLRGAGVNAVRRGHRLHLMALTDDAISALAGNREVSNPHTVHWKEGLKPVTGGLFDESLTGGHGGTRWSYIALTEPLPNPVMEESIRTLLGLTRLELEAVLAGRRELNGMTGPTALRHALARINVPNELARVRQLVRDSRGSARDLAIRRLKVLKAAEKTGIHPAQWIWTKVPVIPPLFRPVSLMQETNRPLVADANYLYRELMQANDALRQLRDRVGDLGHERLTLYNALRGVVGLGDPVQARHRERRIRGFLRHVFGWGPKASVVQQKLLATPVDLTGRGVIVPDPNLDMDEIGIPENQAWEIYAPFIVRRLVRRGMSRLAALRELEDRTDRARAAILEEMDQRPVIVSRAPVLHRYGLLALFPRLIKGDTLHINPTVTGGLGADFDGDAMNYHVPVSEEARREAVMKMLPSRNIFSVRTFKTDIYRPTREFLGGLYEATSRPPARKRPAVFATRRDLLRAYFNGEVGADDPVEIINP